MTLDDMIAKLTELREAHGNLPVTDVAGNRITGAFYGEADDGIIESVYLVTT
jgi:hypothetical protein